MRRTPSCLFAVLICTLLLGAACGSDSGPAETGEGDTAATTTAGERIDTDVGEALLWGDGDSGVVLAHGAAFDAESWTDQATQIAAEGTTVVAVEDISPEGIEAAVTYLKDERGIAGVALIGASAGADGILDLVSQQPDLPDQLIVLSPNSVVDGLGVSPKLFIASEDEPVADVSTEMADTAEGDDNEAIILPGSAHAQNIFDTDQAEPTMTAILDRLNEFAN
ncbi:MULTISPECIES: alpha/beta hydrolase [Candidatus Microthrix]|jgi:hypothetical protein|uniref:alpha/beta hydrolase n=1 Tax=Candidatus Neomicrothrix TaxID=41949 RepID=UPI00036DF024|nr:MULTISPECIES: alpha/beta hydrolase [Microthrix]MBP6134938.1 alpha/beta hydrolase [Candidatus Microthrix sp.]MBP6150678.1 alpha/beta hydrolase [Candidatus Microthrix sp.]MBP7406060.1 alpha/beta hydrolase [Candidatus Microthrix sp.]MBP7851902.1 alpha/beta hydrolase [Candidatus Microthrix sp.]MBP7877061.1 alpha/beta hydrolase [Candidatus Microthrix sp.]